MNTLDVVGFSNHLTANPRDHLFVDPLQVPISLSGPWLTAKGQLACKNIVQQFEQLSRPLYGLQYVELSVSSHFFVKYENKLRLLFVFLIPRKNLVNPKPWARTHVAHAQLRHCVKTLQLDFIFVHSILKSSLEMLYIRPYKFFIQFQCRVHENGHPEDVYTVAWGIE